MIGFLGTYSSQDNEGYNEAVMYAVHKGKPDYSSLDKMKMLGPDNLIVVFKSNRSIKPLFYGKVKDCDIYDLCGKQYPAILVQ